MNGKNIRVDGVVLYVHFEVQLRFLISRQLSGSVFLVIYYTVAPLLHTLRAGGLTGWLAGCMAHPPLSLLLILFLSPPSCCADGGAGN